MQLERLLLDATGCAPGASKRAQFFLLANELNAKHPLPGITSKGVAKWFDRGSIPAPWLMKIAALPEHPLNLSDYA